MTKEDKKLLERHDAMWSDKWLPIKLALYLLTATALMLWAFS